LIVLAGLYVADGYVRLGFLSVSHGGGL